MNEGGINMKIGMLWFDNDPKVDLNGKIEKAASYYRTKYGQSPNLCLVHPSMLANGSGRAREIEIRTTRSMMPNHLWIGVKNGQTGANA
jgi:hypothetical protein